MRIEKDMWVTLDYQVTDSNGDVLDDGKQPLAYHHGHERQLFPVLQAALEGKAVGETIAVTLPPEDGFGEYNGDLVQIVERSAFPADATVGMQVEGGPEGEPTEIYRITDIREDSVVLDGNHPLAGVTLIFTLTVTAMEMRRPA